MDMRILEVAIGLVLVLAISSLLVSTLHEIWTGWRKSRGDSLLLGLCSLLGDNQVTTGKLRRRFSDSKQPSPFTKDLLAHPLLVSQALGGADEQRMPSYLPSDVFISALVSKLSEMATQGQRPATPRLWLSAVKAHADNLRASGDMHQPQPALIGALGTLVQGVENDWSSFELRLCAWYDSVQSRAGGWYRRDTQLRLVILGFVSAAIININPLVIAPRLWSDPVMRAATVGLAQEAVKGYASAASASAAAASAASAPASGAGPETTQAQQLAEIAKALARAVPQRTAAAPASPRASAAAAEAVMTPLALEADQAMKALKDSVFAAAEATRAHPSSSGAMAVKSSVDLLLDLQDQMRFRQKLAAQGGKALLVLDASISLEERLQSLSDALGKAGAHAGIEKQIARLGTALRDERDALLPQTAALDHRTRSAAQLAAQACVGAGEGSSIDALCASMGAAQSLNGSGLPLGWSWANWPECDAACQARHGAKSLDADLLPAKEDSYAEKLVKSRDGSEQVGTRVLRSLFEASQLQLRKALAAAPEQQARQFSLTALWNDADVWNGLFKAIVGWLIIAIAASLGAPFWFDLLNQFVKMRGGGAPAGPGKGGDGDGPADTMTRKPAPPPTGSTGEGASPAGTPAPADSGALNAAERDLSSAQIVRLQTTLNLSGPLASGRLDAGTRIAILKWQQGRGEATPHGELNAAQIGLLLNPVAPSAVPPGASPSVSTMPRRADGTINVLTEAEVRALYGDIATVPQGTGLRIVDAGRPGKAQHRIVAFDHGLLATPQHVHALALPHFQKVFDKIQAAIQAGALPAGVIVNCGGTFVPRHIGSNPQRPLSRHTWGIAIDLNTAANGMGAAPAAADQAGSVRALVPIFNECGFAWGGHFSTGPDGMHFELALRDPAG